jgi:hypothetical protein
MRKLILVVAVALATLSVLSTTAAACGESMFRVGKGVHYRAYSAPIPGLVLVYARTDSERAVAESLQRAGHHVQVVANDEDLGRQMRSQNYDVVVAPFSKRSAVEALSPDIAAHPNWLPVVEDGSADQRLAQAQFDQVFTTNDDVRKYLKAIHKTLKEKSG